MVKISWPKKKIKIGNRLKRSYPFWWKGAMDKWKKDGKGTIDESDPEFDAQKIYKHWLDSFK